MLTKLFSCFIFKPLSTVACLKVAFFQVFFFPMLPKIQLKKRFFFVKKISPSPSPFPPSSGLECVLFRKTETRKALFLGKRMVMTMKMAMKEVLSQRTAKGLGCDLCIPYMGGDDDVTNPGCLK